MNTRGFPRLMPAEAAAMIRSGETISLGGFTTAGNPKATIAALARRAASERSAGRDFRIGVVGVATGPAVDGILADAISFRTPYQCDRNLRERVNSGECRFVDMHLSHVTQAIRYGSLGPLDWAVIEAADLTPAGEILLTSSVGASPTFCARASRIIVELNRQHPPALRGIHDIYEPADPPDRREIPLYSVSDRIGSPVVAPDPARIAGVVEADLPDEGSAFATPGPVTEKIGENVAAFLACEISARRMPATFLPVQSGVGDTANSVLDALGRHSGIPPFQMYTEVIQDSAVRLMKAGRISFASCCSLSVSQPALREIYENIDWFRTRIVLRPQEISNHPEVVRRLGVVSLNTALEADVFGNVNSTHVMGSEMMNGIGGSGDFTRNAHTSIFSCPSTQKSGAISTIVPMVTHVDHTEHCVQVIATEWGVADLRGLAPRERARAMIENCAHPDFRDALHTYLRIAVRGHTPNTLRAAFSFHERYQRTGDMRESQSAAR
jgi:acetyl-CoA hydrolase